MALDPILCVPSTLDPSLLLGLAQAGYKLALHDVEDLGSAPTSVSCALVSGRGGLDAALDAARAIREHVGASIGVVLLVQQGDVAHLSDHADRFVDFAIVPSSAAELLVRIERQTAGLRDDGSQVLVTYGPLTINTETYQAAVDGRTLDLTYMEYELLSFLAMHATKVFTREVLLSKVWGYEYYGGARTVDVHIRRLRAKLGEEHASLIETVRSVGYRLGQSAYGEWAP